MTTKFTINEFRKHYDTDAKCLDKIFQLRYGKLEACPECACVASFRRITEKKEITNITGKILLLKNINIPGENCSYFFIKYEIFNLLTNANFSSPIPCLVSPYQRNVSQVELNKSILVPENCTLTLMLSPNRNEFKSNGIAKIEYEILEPQKSKVIISENDRDYAYTEPVIAKTGKPPVTKWVVKNPLEQKVFIENKGQYALPDKNLSSGDILYGARVGGLQYYFTKTGIWINYEQAIKRTEQEISQTKSQLEATGITIDEKKIQNKLVTEYHQMNFLGANPQVEITSDNRANGYHNFSNKNGSSFTARAFKKITYTNLYPGIDMEIYFREDTTGFEYSFIVHPGADSFANKNSIPVK